jgi:hypothetical protein
MVTMKKDFFASVAFHSGNGRLPSVATRSPAGSKLFPIQYLHPEVNFMKLVFFVIDFSAKIS